MYWKQKWRLNEKVNQITCAVVSNNDGSEVNFNINISSQVSSILNLKEHLNTHPDIKKIKSQKRTTTTIDTLMEKSNSAGIDIDFLNLDIQGAELLALKGVKKHLAAS